MLAAWAVEVLLGWPEPLFRLLRHPVVWIGALIRPMEVRLNQPGLPFAARYALGGVSVLFVTTVAGGLAALCLADLAEGLHGDVAHLI